MFVITLMSKKMIKSGIRQVRQKGALEVLLLRNGGAVQRTFNELSMGLHFRQEANKMLIV